MTATKSLFIAALLSGVAASSFARAPESSIGKGAPAASVAKTAHHKKHHRHHAHHKPAVAKVVSAGK